MVSGTAKKFLNSSDSNWSFTILSKVIVSSLTILMLPPSLHYSSIPVSLHTKRQALDNYRHKTFPFHHFAYIDEVQLRQIDLVNAGKVPFRRKHAAHDSAHVLFKN